jgi:hypothetical protein
MGGFQHEVSLFALSPNGKCFVGWKLGAGKIWHMHLLEFCSCCGGKSGFGSYQSAVH